MVDVFSRDLPGDERHGDVNDFAKFNYPIHYFGGE
jgi:hypothetical protein